jgi:hypothetical protein
MMMTRESRWCVARHAAWMIAVCTLGSFVYSASAQTIQPETNPPTAQPAESQAAQQGAGGI